MMYQFIEKKLALSKRGAKDFCKGTLFTTLLDLALMFPAIFVFFFFKDYLPIILDSKTNATHPLIHYILIAIAFIITMYLIAIRQYRSTFTTVYEESANRRISLAEKLRKLPLAFFGEKNLSDLTATIMEDSTQLEQTFSHTVPQLFASIISILTIATSLFFFNWQLSLALFWVVPISAIILMISRKILHKENLKTYQIKRTVTEQIQEGLETIQEIKAYNQEQQYLSQLNERLNCYEKQLTKGELLTGALVNSAQGFLKLGIATVVIVGATLLISKEIDIFTYLIFLLVAATIYNPINEVFNNLAALFFLDIRINRMNEMAELPVQQGKKELLTDNYDITFKNVHFSYETGKKVLDGISFTAKQNEITALVGPSGGGKTTSAKLAARFWDIDSGTILLGKHDINTIDPEALLQHYSVVFQDVVLFNTSIMENIRVGKRDATDQEVINAAKLAQCEPFINKLPEKYHTIVGENGDTLSGGERQRISIARALLKNAPIVLLDEATASLDVENETKIQEALSELIKNKTVLIIAHRMRTVANADKIIVLKDGKIAESGTPEDLKQQGNIFKQMIARQLN